jgi:hypothetical protein
MSDTMLLIYGKENYMISAETMTDRKSLLELVKDASEEYALLVFNNQ